MKRIAAMPLFLLILTTFPSVGLGQSVPWEIFLDQQSDSACDIVNTANAELVVLSGTGELVVVTGTDLILADTFVDGEGFVFVGGVPVGVIDFATDGDGFRTLWWIGLDGSVVEIDPFTGEPSPTEFTPEDFGQVPCDACELWDDPTDCDGGVIIDDDLDGIDDEFDFCPDTPLDDEVDENGCSCIQLDGDDDGVVDCFDLCPDSIPGGPVDVDGCGCSDFDGDNDGIEDCFDECPDTPLDEIADEAGCSCSDFDSDDDGVDDCFDECPNTPFGDEVDFDGCSDGDVIVVEPPPIFISCGNFSSLTMMSMLAGLCSMRLARRRRSLVDFSLEG